MHAEQLLERLERSPLATERVLQKLEASPAVRKILKEESDKLIALREKAAGELVQATAALEKDLPPLVNAIKVAEADYQKTVKATTAASAKLSQARGNAATIRWRGERKMEDARRKLLATYDSVIDETLRDLQKRDDELCNRTPVLEARSPQGRDVVSGKKRPDLVVSTLASIEEVLAAVRQARRDIEELKLYPGDPTKKIAEVFASIPAVRQPTAADLRSLEGDVDDRHVPVWASVASRPGSESRDDDDE